MKTVNGHQLLEQFSEVIKGHIFPIVGTINDCYNQFPKQDANKLCTKTFWQYFIKSELMVPWNIAVCDEDPECDINNYVFGTHDIETILLFRISAQETIQITISTGTLDALIEYRKCIDGTWQTVDNSYVSVEVVHTARVVNNRVCYTSIQDHCEAHNK